MKATDKVKRILGTKLKFHHHLQHSSMESFHEWITHSVHKSENDAKQMFDTVSSKFPQHFKWRIVKIKL